MSEAVEGEVTIREARDSDSGEIAGLLGELGYPGTADRVARKIEELARAPQSRVLVAATVLWLGAAACRAAGRPSDRTDLAAFFSEVDRTYPFFDLKGIRDDWAAAKRRLSEKLPTCRSDSAFLGIVLDAIRCLRDAHMGLRTPKARIPPPPPEYYPGISFLPATKGRVVVMYPPRELKRTLKTGTIVTKIDGEDARRVLEDRAKAAWGAGGFFSSPQRARLFEFRIPLRGKEGEEHRITYRSGQEERTLVVRSDVKAYGWPHTYNLPAGLKRVGRSFWYTKLPGGAGYMYLRRVDRSVEPGLARALAAHPDAKGWIVDLRGNGGGGYSVSLINRLKALPRPVAALIDAGCISAGETLARDLARLADACLFGSTTAGSSTARRLWTFPSGIASITLPVRSRWRTDRKPIEFNGIEPHVQVEAVPEELLRGLNSAICRAEEYLEERSARR